MSSNNYSRRRRGSRYQRNNNNKQQHHYNNKKNNKPIIFCRYGKKCINREECNFCHDEVFITKQQDVLYRNSEYKAGGLVLFSEYEGKIMILCIKEIVNGQEGIGIPGGRREIYDCRNPLNTALREFNEETGDIFNCRWSRTIRKKLLHQYTYYVHRSKYYALFCKIPYIDSKILNEQLNVLTNFCEGENVKESDTICILWKSIDELHDMGKSNDQKLTSSGRAIIYDVTNHLKSKLNDDICVKTDSQLNDDSNLKNITNNLKNITISFND